MGTFIVAAILVIAILFALQGSLKHMKGEGGCCGGGSVPKIKKQRLGSVSQTRRMKIEGMECENCRRKVENALNSLPQVNASVSLKNQEAVVKLGEAVPDEILKSTVEESGYRVISIFTEF